MAITDSPGLSTSELPSFATAGTLASVFSTAMSLYWSVPTMVAFSWVPFERTMFTPFVPSTT
jgi:hypothetical protein